MHIYLFILFVSLCTVASLLTKKLTIEAAIVGGLIATVIYFGVGWAGIFLMAAFFVLGTLATAWDKETKEKIGIAQENKGRRNTGQVIANGGAAALLGAAAIFFKQNDGLLLLMIAAAFSSATADTVSSELGSVYGKRFYDIISFKSGKRGEDGVVSIEGLLFGLTGSSIIALVYAVSATWSSDLWWIIVAGTIGNIADSLLGATLERKTMLNNNAVNFLNTAIAAAFMLAVKMI